MAETKTTFDWASLAKVLVWPAIAAVALLIFADPLKKQFMAGNIETLKIGSLEMHMRESSLPVGPDPVLATALIGLSDVEVEYIIFADPKGHYSFSQCQGDQETQAVFDQTYTQPFQDLGKRGLATVTATQSDGKACLDFGLTQQGVVGRNFLTGLIAAQLKGATTAQ